MASKKNNINIYILLSILAFAIIMMTIISTRNKENFTDYEEFKGVSGNSGGSSTGVGNKKTGYEDCGNKGLSLWRSLQCAMYS